MKLTVRNLGRLREAAIDLSKDLIVLVGPNNTSKTYVAHVIYGLGEHSAAGLAPLMLKIIRDIAATQPDAALRLKIDLIEFVDRHLSQLLQYFSVSYQKKLAEVLAANEEFVAQTEVALEVDEQGRASAKRTLLDLGFEDEVRFPGSDGLSTLRKARGDSILSCERLPLTTTETSTETPVESQRESAWLLRIASWVDTFITQDALGLPYQQYILPAERAAIQLFSRELALKRTELVDSLLQVKSSARRGASAAEEIMERLEQRARRYPLAIRDSLLLANDLAVHKKRTSPFAPLAELLESRTLGGTLLVADDGEMLFHPHGSGSGLSLHLSSSSVKSLAGLSFFLRHMAEKGQFLIIDEPELNLHPDNQRRIARMLARLARSGIKVLISTHSDYLIRELNNLIMLSADMDGTLRQRHSYDEEETLRPAQVGAYLFNTERSQLIEVKETGIEVETIDREINALNAVSQDIYFSLFGKTRV